MAHVTGTAHTDATLFDHHDMDHRPDPVERRATRRQVLAGVLRTIRTERGWSVNDAASQAGVAPMTFRRLEDGLDVRRRSLTALDGLLGLPLGSVARALDDDLLTLDLARLAGADVSDVAPCTAGDFLDALAERFRSGTSRSGTATATMKLTATARPWPAVDDATRQALDAVSRHVPTVAPTDLEIVNRLIEQLARSTVQTPAVRDLIAAAARSIPDLIAAELHTAERDLADSAVPSPAEHDEAARQAVEAIIMGGKR